MVVQQVLTASRNATWGPTLIYDYAGAELPLVGNSISIEMRQYPGQPGNPALRIWPVAFTDVRLSPATPTADERRRLTLSPVAQVGAEDGSTPNTLRALPGLHNPEAGDPQTFAFDILLTYADQVTEILSSGQIIVSPGVTVA